MNGYAGKLLRVNLSKEKISKEEISESLKKDFLGGRGFAAKILWDEVKKADPLSEKNKLIFSTGPLTGQAATQGGLSHCMQGRGRKVRDGFGNTPCSYSNTGR